MLIKRARAGTECEIGEEQCGFRQAGGCKDQEFAVGGLWGGGKYFFIIHFR